MLGDAYCNGISRLNVFGDSLLVINFMTGSYTVKAPNLVDYVQAAKTLSSRF